jgi:hypothetical protein
MSVPIGTQGNSKSSIDPIYEGGPDFFARIKMLEDARRSHDESLHNLGLGKDTVASYRDAKDKLDAATKVKNEADATLARAKADASAMLAKAKAEADSLLKEARASADAAAKEALDTRAKADSYAYGVRDGAAAVGDRAARAWKEVETAQADLKAKLDKYAIDSATLKSATDDAAKLRASLTDKIDRLHSHMKALLES